MQKPARPRAIFILLLCAAVCGCARTEWCGREVAGLSLVCLIAVGFILRAANRLTLDAAGPLRGGRPGPLLCLAWLFTSCNAPAARVAFIFFFLAFLGVAASVCAYFSLAPGFFVPAAVASLLLFGCLTESRRWKEFIPAFIFLISLCALAYAWVPHVARHELFRAKSFLDFFKKFGTFAASGVLLIIAGLPGLLMGIAMSPKEIV